MPTASVCVLDTCDRVGFCRGWCVAGLSHISQCSFQERPKEMSGNLKMQSVICWVRTLRPLLTCF